MITTYHFLPDGSDFNLLVSTITTPANHLRSCVYVQIANDTEVEGTENFFIELSYSGMGNVIVNAPATVEVLIMG